ncbi:MAG: hypothetical protein J6E38_08050 [Clostridia bacterium]|nr:hypothetical protein [Clostridia bacterium]
MKKLSALLISVLLILTLVACGGDGTPKAVTSDVELMDTAGDRISYLFAPEGFSFDEVSEDGGYNSGRNHMLETEDGDYEINAGLIANSESTLYDLFVNGELTKTNYNGTEIGPDEEYKLETKEELDFEVAGNKVYYLERTIDGGYFTTYVAFEHTDKDGEAALYGLDLWSNDEEFYSRENSIKVFKDVFGIGRTKSAVYFEKAEDEAEEEDTYGTLEYVDMIYGSDEFPLTISKPENGTIELDAEDAEEVQNFVWITSDDYEWTIDVHGSVLYYNGNADDAFVEYYYNGELDCFAEDYTYFDETVYELDIAYNGQAVKVIEYTFIEDDEEEEETEYFVGVEFEDTYYGEYYGDGLVGYRYYMFDEEPTLDELSDLFTQVFGVGGFSSAVPEEDNDDWDDEGLDTAMIEGDWEAVDSLYDEAFFFYDDYTGTYIIQDQEVDFEYFLTDDGFLSLVFENGQELYYTVAFDGSDTMIFEDDYGNEIEFERI